MSQAKQHPQKSIESVTNKIICGDSLKILKTFPDNSIDCVVTSPPYGALRDYGIQEQIGFGMSTEEYLERLVNVFTEIHRVLKSSGTLWVNLGDAYANKTKGKPRNKPPTGVSDSPNVQAAKLNVPPKSLCLIPSRFALLMIRKGWILRNEIIWHKPNQMPQSVQDRFTVDFEKLFFFVKERKYYFNRQFEPLRDPERLKRRQLDSEKNHKCSDSYWFSTRPEISRKRKLRMLKQGRNKRCVWTIGTASFAGNHFAVYPERLIETPMLAGCPENGIVLDPFLGSGTTAVVAKKLG